MSMMADVHLSERAGVSHAHHLHGEIPEEIDDLQRFAAQAENEDERRDDGTEQLLEDEHLPHGMEEKRRRK